MTLKTLVTVSGLLVATAAAGAESLYRQAQAEAAAAEVSTQAAGASEADRIGLQSLTAPPKANPRTFSKEQLVTIIVREAASHATDASATTARESGVDAAVEQFVHFSFNGGNFIRPVDFSKEGAPAIKADAERDFSGSGSTGRTDSLTARITGKIIDIKPNGNLVIEASKRIVVDEEAYSITLTGVCRTEDVTPDNTVLSTQMSELEINKKSLGMVKDATKRGLLHRIADAINIF